MMKLKQIIASVACVGLLVSTTSFAKGKIGSINVEGAFKDMGSAISRAAQDLASSRVVNAINLEAHVLNAVRGISDNTTGAKFVDLLWQRYDAIGGKAAEARIAQDIASVDALIKTALSDPQSKIEAEKVSVALKQITAHIKIYLKNKSMVAELDVKFLNTLPNTYKLNSGDSLGRSQTTASGHVFAKIGDLGKIEIAPAAKVWQTVLGDTVGKAEVTKEASNVSVRRLYTSVVAEIGKQNGAHQKALRLLADNLNPDGPSGKYWLGRFMGLSASEIVSLTKRGIPLSTVFKAEDMTKVLGAEDAAYMKFAKAANGVLTAFAPRPAFTKSGEYNGVNGPFLDLEAARTYLFTVVDKQVSALAPTYFLGKKVGNTITLLDAVKVALGKEETDGGVREVAHRLLTVLAYSDQNAVVRAALHDLIMSKNLDEGTIRKTGELENTSRACMNM